MVFYFKYKMPTEVVVLYMGKDKYENEDLIRWGWPEDVWFHVHNFSSAHVYLRLKKGETMDGINPEVITAAAQLCKENSIEGKKQKSVEVVYTMWENLHKTTSMEPGQVSFVSEKAVKKIRIERDLEIVKKINKTKSEDFPDLRMQRELRDSLERKESKEALRTEQRLKEEELKSKKLEASLRSFESLRIPEKMVSNYDDGNDSDDFM